MAASAVPRPLRRTAPRPSGRRSGPSRRQAAPSSSALALSDGARTHPSARRTTAPPRRRPGARLGPEASTQVLHQQRRSATSLRSIRRQSQSRPSSSTHPTLLARSCVRSGTLSAAWRRATCWGERRTISFNGRCDGILITMPPAKGASRSRRRGRPGRATRLRQQRDPSAIQSDAQIIFKVQRMQAMTSIKETLAQFWFTITRSAIAHRAEIHVFALSFLPFRTDIASDFKQSHLLIQCEWDR